MTAAAATEVLAEWPRLSLNERFPLWLVASPGERVPLGLRRGDSPSEEAGTLER